MIDRPAVTVVIPTHRRPHSLMRVLHGLSRQDAPPGSLQLVRISLEVWWMARGERKSVQLDGYRRDVIPQEGRR